MRIIKCLNEIFRPVLSHLDINNIHRNKKKNILYFIDVSKFHVYEQLLLEESLFRICNNTTDGLNNIGFVIVNNTCEEVNELKSNECSFNNNNKKCVILGISNKINDHIKDINYIKENNISLIKRFTGGGTIYINQNSLLVSLILPHKFEKKKKIYPSNITEWSYNYFYNTKVQINDKRTITNEQNNVKKNHILFNEYFNYYENDYVYKSYDEDNENIILKKVGGNAQSFARNYFLHHTSYIWTCNYNEMNHILLNPSKQPIYRNKRKHQHFLQSIKLCLHNDIYTPNLFIEKLIKHIKYIINYKNSNDQYDYWFLNKIIFKNINDHISINSKHFDDIYLADINLLQNIFNYYNNSNIFNNMRSTYFLDHDGKKVSDTYYDIPTFFIK
ncbi:lipoate-protein ligase 2 [Plasmodium gaboni]|uniref:Lipoate-protein ligase 2 n=1 Tax=Plasmodium gaboni TaxID=647221 RepID=A0A151LM73_9APIC|nr:lipoate-protein ligase 2 [Plasmodium gaboni]KYO00217.1 lipoate-protein ligase 2 [Plasmodium gaboni]